MDEDQIRFILTVEEVLVIGTVKKIDDLRRVCLAHHPCPNCYLTEMCPLRFDKVLHDEFARQPWLDFYSVAKVCAIDGTYTAFGDPKQTKVQIEEGIWQHPDRSSQESMRGYRAALLIQKDPWSEYLRWQKTNGKNPTRELKKKMETCAPLLENRRSHPGIVSMFSRAWYDNCMKPSAKFAEPSFAFPTLEHRVIFVHCDSSSVAAKVDQKAYRNDVELSATREITTKLMSCGVPQDEIMLLSAYALHAHRMGGLTVAAAQGAENTVVIFNVVKYGQASDTSGTLSLRGDVFNTAGTRAKSLLLIVADTQQMIYNVEANSGVRRLMSWSPIIPLQDFLATLHDAHELNTLLATKYAAKQRQQPSSASKKRKCQA